MKALLKNDNRPKAYIDGSVEFYDLTLKVDERCLIPRLESELLVERVLKRLPKNGKVLDLCCGSGALGLAIKSQRLDLEVVLVDISKGALEVARQNAKNNDLLVEFVLGDFLEAIKGQVFDVIICNPPYVTQVEYEELEDSVKGFEPKLALVGGVDGLCFYKKLSAGLKDCLSENGLVALEIGKDQGEAIKKLFGGGLVEKDYSGHDRFFFKEYKRVINV
ncbi:MAG: Release factor glutamine methyltransferase [Chlamydiia bacterium]|nr:Release factor glutamine methyltransferase [Chlamydiia bacterium]